MKHRICTKNKTKYFTCTRSLNLQRFSLRIHILKKKLKLIDVNLPGFPKQGSESEPCIHSERMLLTNAITVSQHVERIFK